jgi:hypothetical protein
MKSRRPERGAALLFVMSMVALLMMVVLGLLYYTSSARQRSIRAARALTELPCAESGLQIARSYYWANVGQWNSFLSSPETYNPIGWTGSSKSIPKAGPNATALETSKAKALRDNFPQLFADLDGDGQPDVYIYIRDDVDESPNNPLQDNNQTVIVGAVCISDTLVPRRQDGTIDPSMANVEAMLSYSMANRYTAQRSCGSTGTGNCN